MVDFKRQLDLWAAGKEDKDGIPAPMPITAGFLHSSFVWVLMHRCEQSRDFEVAVRDCFNTCALFYGEDGAKIGLALHTEMFLDVASGAGDQAGEGATMEEEVSPVVMTWCCIQRGFWPMRGDLVLHTPGLSDLPVVTWCCCIQWGF
jgi:hypothetical protein